MGLWEICQIAEDITVGVKRKTLVARKKRQKLEKRLSHTVKEKR